MLIGGSLKHYARLLTVLAECCGCAGPAQGLCFPSAVLAQHLKGCAGPALCWPSAVLSQRSCAGPSAGNEPARAGMQLSSRISNNFHLIVLQGSFCCISSEVAFEAYLQRGITLPLGSLLGSLTEVESGQYTCVGWTLPPFCKSSPACTPDSPKNICHV